MSGDTSAPSQPEGTGRPVGTTPLFRIDPGWPFVISGLALIVSAVLIPAQRELHDLEQRLKVHQAYEERTKAELVAYQQFIRDLGDDATNERLLERLVRAQLNKMPKDERPLLLMPTANETVPTWIESSVTLEIPEPTPYADTLLSRIASGPRRLWVLATGAFLVFLGVMFAPTTFSTSRRRPEPIDAPRDGHDGEFHDSAGGVATLEADDAVEGAADDVDATEDASEESGKLDAADAADAADEGVVEDAVEELDSAGPCADAATVAVESESSVVSISASSIVEPEIALEAGVSQRETATSVEVPEVEVAEVEVAEVEDAEVPEPEPQICSIETFPSDFAQIASHEPETLDSALDASEMHEAQDIHELQYDETELDAIDVPADDDADPGEAVASAETMEPPEEVEPIVERASVPDANDRALDSTSLFAGLDESRWIETRSQSQRS